MKTTDKEKRIQQVTTQIRMLTNELAMLVGIVDNGIKDVTSNPEVILDIVMKVFGTNPRTAGRKNDVVIARFAATYLMRRYTRLRNEDISKLQGGVEHSVVNYRVTQAKNLIDTNEDFRNKINECMSQIEMRL